MRDSLGIIGGGRFGVCVAHVSAVQGKSVLLFVPERARREQLQSERSLPGVLSELDRLDSGVTLVDTPQELAERAQLLLFTGAKDPIEETLDALGDVLTGAHQVVHTLHRLHGPRLSTTSALFRERTACIQLGALAGALHAAALLEGQPNAAVVGSAFPDVVARTRSFLQSPATRLYRSADLQGVELAAALVQIVAVALGVVDGLELGSAPHAVLMTRALSEIAALGARLGATPQTFYGLAGLGRLVDACRRAGPNYEHGRALGQARETPMESGPSSEGYGVTLIPSVLEFALREGVLMPVTAALADVLEHRREPREAIAELVRDGS